VIGLVTFSLHWPAAAKVPSVCPRTLTVVCCLHVLADEGYMATGVTTDKTDAAIQANIVAAKYVNPHFPGYKN
jgi:hypothetical protein